MWIISLATPNNNDDLAWVIVVEWDKKYAFYQYQIHKKEKLLECEYSIHWHIFTAMCMVFQIEADN